MKVTGKEDPDIAAVREMLHTLYAYTSDEANPPGEGRSWSHQQGRAALDRLASRLAETEMERASLLRELATLFGPAPNRKGATDNERWLYHIGARLAETEARVEEAEAALRNIAARPERWPAGDHAIPTARRALAGKDAEMSDNTEKKPWDDWPEAGPDDWELCPKCGNMDGGCPFCGHGYIPKEGFKWPKPQRTGAA